jgi:hypothetical protein
MTSQALRKVLIATVASLSITAGCAKPTAPTASSPVGGAAAGQSSGPYMSPRVAPK